MQHQTERQKTLVEAGLHIKNFPVFHIDWDFYKTELQYRVSNQTLSFAVVVIVFHKIIVFCQNVSNPRMPGSVALYPALWSGTFLSAQCHQALLVYNDCCEPPLPWWLCYHKRPREPQQDP